MKKRLFNIFFIITSFTAVCQEGKKKYYMLDNLVVSEKLFKTLDKRKIFIKTVENDTAVIEHIFRHKNIGQLDSTQHEQMKMMLSKITNFEFDENVSTMIHLYRNDNKIYKDAEYRKYWNWIERNHDRFQSFLVGARNSGVRPEGKEHIYVDSYDFFENLFFRNSDFDINHLLIKPNGEIYIYYGIDDILHVLDWSVD